MMIVKGQSFPLGVSKRESQINFAVEVPEGTSAKLLDPIQNLFHRICNFWVFQSLD